MKKLTKRVQAGGLWFDVNENTKSVTIDSDGHACCWQGDVFIAPGGSGWSGCGCDPIGRVDLEGADWRECCWYVGDQEDGEAVERREWVNELLGKFKEIENNRFNQEDEYYLGHQTGWNECLQSIRAGEIK